MKGGEPFGQPPTRSCLERVEERLPLLSTEDEDAAPAVLAVADSCGGRGQRHLNATL